MDIDLEKTAQDELDKILEKDEEYCKKELEKCKNDTHYFYNTYCLVNGEKPEPISKEDFDSIQKLIKNYSPVKLRRHR